MSSEIFDSAHTSMSRLIFIIPVSRSVDTLFAFLPTDRYEENGDVKVVESSKCHSHLNKTEDNLDTSARFAQTLICLNHQKRSGTAGAKCYQ